MNVTRGEKPKVQIIYVNESGNRWVYYLETKMESDAVSIAADLAARGKRAIVSSEYQGPVIIR